ncbi:MAG: SGNH/GDSL hydrolase family protein [Firmicutes bacterium]|nr:SGNH/GDSL hydrolase family protein [Bacillota bacterium]
MRKGKKITMALMALLSTGMLFSAVACGGNGDSASSSSGGTNSSTDSSSGNSQSSSSIDAERLDKIPDSELKTESAVGGTTATASWFAVYGENAMEFTVYVEDATIYTQGGLYNNDGVELLLTKVQRVKGYSEHTISVVVDATGDFQVKNLSTNAQVTDSGVTAKATAFTLTGTAVDGYYLNISVPYAAIEATKEKKDAAVCLGITNAKNAVDLKTVYDTTYHTDYKNIHTFMAITADNTYAANPYVQYGMVWGDGGSLKASSVWNIENDDGTENAHISMTGVDNLDNYIYMHGSNKTTFYGEAKINVKELLNGEKWGKFGLIMTSADGQDGFLFYVDAASADGKAFNENSVSLGFNTRTDGKWDGNWSNIGTLGGTSAQYTGSGYITLGIYRQGGVYKLYANDQLVKMVSCGIGTDEEAYLGLASFNITMDVKEYSLETDPSKLDEYKIVTEAKDYLFLGDSYIDTAFWYTYDNVFGTLSAANEGVGGTKTSYWMSMVETIKQMYDPKNIVIHIGVNDIDDGNTTGETTIGRLDALIDAYQTAFPETNIYYVGLVHNMMFQNKWAEYDKVNAHMKALAQDDPKLNFIDMAQYITANEKGSTMSWFNADGLHYGVDGYAVLNREIYKALGIQRTASKNGLGDVTAEGAPAFSYSGGWTFDAEGTAHNTGKAESQIFLSDLYAADFYAEVKISVAGLTAPDDFAKAGLAVRTTEGTWFWALDANKNDNKEKYINGWSQVYNRMDTIKRDWDWGGCFGAFQWTYNNQYPDKYANGVSYDYKTDGSFKTMAIAKVGADLWFIADGKVVNCLIGVMGADTKAAVSVFNFNMEMYAKDGLVITDAAALKTKLDSMKIYETTKTVDGDISDWTDAQKANPYVIPATDGRSVTIYATMESDGIYVFYDVIHNSYITDKPEWFNNTNLELKFKDNLQRFADAAGLNSRWEFSARQINASKFISTTENGKHHTKAELFISYSCIDGLDKSDLQTFMGFAWKTGGETGFAWGGGDFWYGAEADPGMPNIIVTKNGIRTGSIKTIDGDISDWKDETFTAANVKAGVTATYSAFLGNDGLYFAMEVKEASIDVTGTNTAGDWWKNTNLEFFANENSNTRAARVMTFGGNLYHTGYITDAAMNYADGETEDTWTIEVFIANEHLINVTSETASMKLDMGGQLYGAVTDTWQDYVRNTVINRKA